MPCPIPIPITEVKPPAPTILGSQDPGKIGRRQIILKSPTLEQFPLAGGFFVRARQARGRWRDGVGYRLAKCGKIGE